LFVSIDQFVRSGVAKFDQQWRAVDDNLDLRCGDDH
jgi:hypothetical protein